MSDIQKFKLVADSSGDVKGMKSVAFESAPLRIKTAEREFVDHEEMNVEEMVTYLRSYKGRSSTSCPNVEDWLATFGDAEYVFCVTITATLSGSYNSASTAKRIYEEQHPGRRVHVINSLSTGPEMKLILEKLEEYILAGLDFDTIVERITEYGQSTGLLFLLESLRNLANNGRVSPLVANVAGILGIRVLGKASDVGDLEQLDKCRGSKNALDAVLRRLGSLGYTGGRLRISHCLNEGAAGQLASLVIAAYPGAEIEIYPCRGLCSFYAERGGLLIGFEKGTPSV